MTLWNDLEMRARERYERLGDATFVVSRSDAVLEENEFGTVRWYMHPALPGLALSSLYLFEVELEPSARTGMLRHQGGIVCLAVEGRGRITLDGEVEPWEARDVIGIPGRPAGVTFRFENTEDVLARLIVAFPNWDSALGVGLGSGIEILEPRNDVGVGA